MHRRHEAVRRGFEWFDAGFDAGLTHQRSEAGTLYRATNETHPTRAATPLHHTPTTDASVPITKSSLNYPAGSGPYVPTKVRR